MIPNEKELIDYIRKNELVNFSMIARSFDIKNSTVTDLILDLEKKKKVKVKKFGGSKVIFVKWSGKKEGRWQCMWLVG